MLGRYILIGCLATAIFYLVANALALVCSAHIATFMGNLTSFVFGYFAQMRYAFGVRARHSVMLPRYLALLCLIFAYGQLITLVGQGFSYVLVSLCIALSVPLFSYPLQKFWVFREVEDSKTTLGGGGNTLLKRQYLAHFYPLFCFIFYHTSLFIRLLSKSTSASPLSARVYRFSLFIPATRLQNLPRFFGTSFLSQIHIPPYLTHKEF